MAYAKVKANNRYDQHNAGAIFEVEAREIERCPWALEEVPAPGDPPPAPPAEEKLPEKPAEEPQWTDPTDPASPEAASGGRIVIEEKTKVSKRR